MSRIARSLTVATFATIAGLHVAWGRGSSFPFATRAELSDAVAGSNVVPTPTACNAVALALLAASALVADVPIAPRRLRRTGRRVVAVVLGTRGIAGMAGLTDRLVPGRHASARFRALDRRYYSPLCLALAAATAHR